MLEGKPIYADCFGNLVPLTKSGQHHLFSFFAFKENRLALFIKVSTPHTVECGQTEATQACMVPNTELLLNCCCRSETTLRSHVAVCPLWRSPGTTGHSRKMPYATLTSPSRHTARYDNDTDSTLNSTVESSNCISILFLGGPSATKSLTFSLKCTTILAHFQNFFC